MTQKGGLPFYLWIVSHFATLAMTKSAGVAGAFARLAFLVVARFAKRVAVCSFGAGRSAWRVVVILNASEVSQNTML